MIKFRNGYDIKMVGGPTSLVKVLPDPATLCLPLSSRRLAFTKLLVREGADVQAGQVLAVAPEQYGIPLIAPLSGTVRLRANRGHITLEAAQRTPYPRFEPQAQVREIPAPEGAEGSPVHQLLCMGAWPVFTDANTGALPDPFAAPSAVMVIVPSLEPFVTRGGVVVAQRLPAFISGLEQLHRAGNQDIHLVIPQEKAAGIDALRAALSTCDWIRYVPVPSRYPADNPRLLARLLGFKAAAGPVWSVTADGVLAVNTVLADSQPVVATLMTIAGPGVTAPCHVEALHGTPFAALSDLADREGSILINGGVLTGSAIPAEQCGVDLECRGLTVVPRRTKPEFLAFVLPGEDRLSYSRCFLSALRLSVSDHTTTHIRGEHRACIACGYCEGVCPAELLPQVLHRFLYAEQLDESEAMGLDLCVACGLCTYVCPCKIDLQKQFAEAKQTLLQEAAEAV